MASRFRPSEGFRRDRYSTAFWPSGEYRRAGALPGLDASAVETLAAFGHAAAFPRGG